MEASSHGLDQFRLDGVRLAAAAFTNLTRDHLDYHGTLEAYRLAKLRLFEDLLPSGAPAVVHGGMENFAVRALKVGILDNFYSCIRVAQNMVCRSDRREVNSLCGAVVSGWGRGTALADKKDCASKK